MEEIRQAIMGQVHQLVGAGSKAIDLDGGDAGLFGPRSASWRVHGDFTAMMIGGLSALLMQMLHPGALAGVWDHSNFRKDRLGRLKRTAQFIAATTYGSTVEAERLISRVRSIHDRVEGVMPDGTSYSANDPKLLTWVHVAETSNFLRAFMRYRDPDFSPADQDRYFDEMAEVARRLGAEDVPVTRRGIEAYLRDIRPELRVDGRTREVTGILMTAASPSLALVPFGVLVRQASIDLLPEWAATMHGFRMPMVRKPAIRMGALAVGSVMRWALKDNSASRARRRVASA